MPQRKYFSEFALNMMASLRVLVQQEHLEQLAGKPAFVNDPCHIYIIGRRPRIAVDPASIALSEDSMTGILRVQHGYEFTSHPFTLPGNFGTNQLKVICPFPHTLLTLERANGHSFSIKAALIPLHSPSLHSVKEDLDLEVLYIGQSYGVEGARTAPDRLRNHSTLQGIYAEALSNAPDKDIWLMLMGFHPPIVLASFDGISKNYGTSMEEDEEHMNRVLASEITEQQQINFTEAALIRYFRPPYNILYKDRFPNPAHQTYSECYDLEINAVSVEIHTDDLGLRLWSEAVPKQWVHFAQFPLYSREDRLSIFEIPDREHRSKPRAQSHNPLTNRQSISTDSKT